MLHSSRALKVLVVDSDELHGYACALLSSREDVASAFGPEAVSFQFGAHAYDIALMAVGKSLLHTMVIAAGMRAIERQQPLRRRVTIIACTATSCDYEDSLVSASALSGALSSPWSIETVHACLDRWRAGKYLCPLGHPDSQAHAIAGSGQTTSASTGGLDGRWL